MTDELPFQTYERISGREWPGGDSKEIQALLRLFGINDAPGSEAANLALQERLLSIKWREPPARQYLQMSGFGLYFLMVYLAETRHRERCPGMGGMVHHGNEPIQRGRAPERPIPREWSPATGTSASHEYWCIFDRIREGFKP